MDRLKETPTLIKASKSGQTEKNLAQSLDGFISLGNGYYAVKGEKNYVIFSSINGLPFIITKELFQKALNGELSEEELTLFGENGVQLSITEEETREGYNKYIRRYIENYKGPSVLDLAISEMCNLNCHMCIHSFARQKEKPRGISKILNFETAKAWIDFYIDNIATNNNLERLTFHFGAAEPFLNKKTFLRCLSYIKSRTNGENVDLSVNSNITLLDDELLKELSITAIRVNVGLDGLQPENDSIRMDKNGKGSFDTITKNLRILKANDISVGVNLTLTDRNFSKVDPREFLYFMKSLGIDAVLVDIDFVKGVNFPHDLVISKLMEFQKVGDELGMEIRGNWKAPFYNLVSEMEDEPKSFCASIRGKNLVVTPSKNLCFCTYTSNITNTYGDKDLKASFDKFTENMQSNVLQNLLLDDENKCLGCPIIGFCSGGCSVTSEQKEGVDYMCGIYRLSTEKLINYYFGSEDPLSEDEVLAP